MTATVPSHAGVALRAYFIWDGEGRPHGRHEDHWFAAEALEARAAEMEAATAAPVLKAAPAKAPAARKAAAPRKAAQPKAAAPVNDTSKAAVPKAPAETVVAAAALAAPRAAKAAAKGARRTH